MKDSSFIRLDQLIPRPMYHRSNQPAGTIRGYETGILTAPQIWNYGLTLGVNDDEYLNLIQEAIEKFQIYPRYVAMDWVHTNDDDYKYTERSDRLAIGFDEEFSRHLSVLLHEIDLHAAKF